MQNYVLYIAGWYPSYVDAYSGDFVQRHAACIAIYQPVIVVFLVKSAAHKKVTIEIKEDGTLLEYIVYYPKKKIGDKLWSHFYYTKLYKAIITNIFTTYGAPKLVHTYIAWKAGFIALYIKKKYNIPYVLSDQSSAYYTEDLNFIGSNTLKYKIVKKIFANAAALITISHIYYKNCSKLFKLNKPYYVIENCVQTDYFFFEAHDNIKPLLIHVSTMDYPKNVEGLLQAISAVSKIRTDFEVLLVGNIWESVVAQVKQLGLEKLVTFTGVVPYNEVATYVRRSDAMLLFSRFEGLPCVILEGFCSGIPLISTNVGGIPEVVDDANGILVNEGDIESMANAILHFLSNRHQYNNNEIALQASAKYSYEAIGKKFISVYESVLKQTASS